MKRVVSLLDAIDEIVSIPVKAISLLLCLVIITCAWSCSNALAEISKYEQEILPFAELVPAFVCPVSPVACTAVTAGMQVFNPVAQDVSSLFSQWSTASASAQPGLIAQLLVTVQQLQDAEATLVKDAQVKNPNAQAQINGVTSSLLAATGDFLKLLVATQTQGGTTQAFNEVMRDAVPVSDSALAFWSAGKTITYLFVKSDSLKLKNGAVIHTWDYHKRTLRTKLLHATGDAQVDAISKKLAEQVKTWR